MKKKIKNFPFIAAVIVAVSFLINRGGLALAWDNEKTHKDLSRVAAEKSVIGSSSYLDNIGFKFGLDEKFAWNGQILKAKEWIEDGAFDEDAGTPAQGIAGTARYINHFHNPLKDWPDAGLNDTVLGFGYNGESSLLWAQDTAMQSGWLGRDWSWHAIRDFFYNALTKNTDLERQAYFAQTFKGLGHQMHLVQDAAQPDHVRNDAHPWSYNQVGGLNIESWAAGNSQIINTLATTPIFPEVSFNVSNGYVPITQLVDTDQYDGAAPSVALTRGIAEYTNANFASEHTTFAEENQTNDPLHFFPYPRKSSTDLQDYINQNKLPETVTAEDGIPDTGFWIKKTGDGEIYDHFSKPTYLTELLKGTTVFYRSFYQDRECYKDTVKFLIPRAVGYSAALLDYFFRGQIDMADDPLQQDYYVILLAISLM